MEEKYVRLAQEKYDNLLHSKKSSVSVLIIFSIVFIIISVVFRIHANELVASDVIHTDPIWGDTWSENEEQISLFNVLFYMALVIASGFIISVICKIISIRRFRKQRDGFIEKCAKTLEERDIEKAKKESDGAFAKFDLEGVASSLGSAISKARNAFMDGYNGEKPLPKKCPSCGADTSPGSSCCEYCGARLK